MAPRPYRLSRRAASAQETHRRIVKATFTLHVEKGVAATTFRDIAERADVGIGTIYQHFPTYEHLIDACGHHAFDVMRPPRPEIFGGASGLNERIHVLVRELFAFYERFPAFGHIRAERHQFAALERGIAHEEEGRRALIAAALRGARASKNLRAIIFSLLDFNVYQSLRACGVDHDGVVQEITSLLLVRARGTRRM
jgi:AcrR family transcriptional regulator